MDDLQAIQELHFDGDAWLKIAVLDARGEGDRPMQRRIAAAVAAWRADPDAGLALLPLLVDDLLCEQLPESSYFAEYDRGPWVPCEASESVAIARELHGWRGCESSARALAWFERLPPGGSYRYDGDIRATARLTDTLIAFFIDRG